MTPATIAMLSAAALGIATVITEAIKAKSEEKRREESRNNNRRTYDDDRYYDDDVIDDEVIVDEAGRLYRPIHRRSMYEGRRNRDFRNDYNGYDRYDRYRPYDDDYYPYGKPFNYNDFSPSRYNDIPPYTGLPEREYGFTARRYNDIYRNDYSHKYDYNTSYFGNDDVPYGWDETYKPLEIKTLGYTDPRDEIYHRCRYDDDDNMYYNRDANRAPYTWGRESTYSDNEYGRVRYIPEDRRHDAYDYNYGGYSTKVPYAWGTPFYDDSEDRELAEFVRQPHIQRIINESKERARRRAEECYFRVA